MLQSHFYTAGLAGYITLDDNRPRPMRHREKFEEVVFHLHEMQTSFIAGDGKYQHYFNSFLSAAQSVFFCLNKEFNKHLLYDGWQKKRGSRLPEVARTFKELRNISEKEGPVKNSAVFTGMALQKGTTLPAHATFTGPYIDTRTGKPTSNRGTITTKEGVATEVELDMVHDFVVVIQSDGKTYKLDRVISDARLYADAIRTEMEQAEKKFLKGRA